MLLWIFYSAIILIVGFLFVPIIIRLDTDNEVYRMELKGLITISLKPHETEILQIKVRMLFRDFYLYPLRKKTDRKTKRYKKKAKFKSVFKFSKVLGLLRSFKVEVFQLNIDTGNCIANAKLFPLFAYLDYEYGGFHVNFSGQNRMVIQLQNRPIRLLTSFINI